jgi:hypothetical protein
MLKYIRAPYGELSFSFDLPLQLYSASTQLPQRHQDWVAVLASPSLGVTPTLSGQSHASLVGDKRTQP